MRSPHDEVRHDGGFVAAVPGDVHALAIRLLLLYAARTAA
jgi:hypothetical protein